MGVDMAPANFAYGVSARFTYVNPVLCNEDGGTYLSASSAWVALTALGYPSSSANDIYQVGWLKCQFCGLPTSVRWIWAYGRGASAECGAALNPSARDLGAAGTSLATYKIDRVRLTPDETVYRAYINGVLKAERPSRDLDICWGSFGPARAKAHNEVKQYNDQAGGTVAAPQSWTAITYKDGASAWHSLGSDYDGFLGVIELATMRCVIGPTLGDRFRSWDSRT